MFGKKKNKKILNLYAVMKMLGVSLDDFLCIIDKEILLNRIPRSDKSQLRVQKDEFHKVSQKNVFLGLFPPFFLHRSIKKMVL